MTIDLNCIDAILFSIGIASGSMMTGMTGSSGNNSAGQIIATNSMGSPFDNILNGGDWNSPSGGNVMNTINATQNQDPLSNLMDSVNSLDPLNSMGKSLNEQVCFLFNHTTVKQQELN